MEGIKISLNEVSNLANSLRSINTNISEVLNNTRSEMLKLQEVWQSNGSETIRERFNLFSKQFDEAYSVIDAYAKFLDMTVTSYENLETTINTNAQSFN